jgi:hypothetical protein
MATQAIPVGVRPAFGRPRSGVIGRMVAAVFLALLLLGLGGLAATGDWPGAGATPPEGPAVGLDL